MKTAKRQGVPIEEVHVVPELCMNFRNCARLAPGAFRTDPATGKTRPARWERVDSELVWRAGWSCPSGAIRFVTAEGYVAPRWDEVARWETAHHRAAALQPGEPVDAW